MYSGKFYFLYEIFKFYSYPFSIIKRKDSTKYEYNLENNKSLQKAVKLHKQILNETITAVRSVNYVPDKIY